MDIIKVSANSRTSAVAGAIVGVIREHKHAEIQAIGAGAVNQAIKALIVATGYLKGDGIDVVVRSRVRRRPDRGHGADGDQAGGRAAARAEELPRRC